MKILMLTPYLPYPPSSGGQVRSYNLIKNLAKKHEITLFSLIKTDEEKQYVSALAKLCKRVEVFKRPEKPWTLANILRTGFGFYPFLVVRNSSPEEKERLAEILREEKFDLIHAETFYVMPHIPKTTIPILLVDQTLEYQVYQHFADTFEFLPIKPLLYIDVAKLKFWETRFWRKATKVVAVSEADKEKMEQLVPELDVEIVPNGVGEDLMNIWQKNKTLPAKPIIFFQGNFLWLQNTEAAKILAKEIFPRIKKEVPLAICRIVGQGAKGKIGDLEGDGVEICDLPTSDIEGVMQAYKESSVFLSPLAGPGGTRLKILGAMAAGVPVVTTSTGIEGIGAKNDKEVLIRDNPEDIAKAAIKLLNDKEFYQKVTFAARKLVENKYDWQKISQVLDKIYEEVGRAKQN
ncbi:MAG: glycosyltransferase family 4 protein [bacterium]|nr:glycosyltransferase family 4 protein [bacterium]